MKTIYKFFSTPSGATFISMVARSGNTLLLLPLISKVFPIEYFNVWMLFAVVYSLKDLLDLGLVPNFSRLFSYAYGGLVDLKCLDGEKYNKPNVVLINKIYTVARKVYVHIAVVAFFLILLLGTIAVQHPISDIGDNIVWGAWGVVVVTMPLVIYGNIYSSLLLGVEMVAFVKKWDAIFNILSLLCSCLILFLTKSFLLLTASFYIFNVLIVVRNHIFVSRLHLLSSQIQVFERGIWIIVRDLAGKNLIAGLSNFGLQRGVEILVGNVASVGLSSSYLFSSRLLEQLKAISSIYFYPKVQIFASQYIQKSKRKVLASIQKDMFLSSALLLGGIIFLFLGGWKLLKIFGLNVDFVSRDIWIWMGGAALLERCISMFAETYGILNNKVISHVGLVVSGALFLLFSYFLLPHFGIQAIPMSFVIAYIAFYMEYAICKLKSVQIPNAFLIYAISPILILCIFYGIYMSC